jgi:hypothetical protein
MIILYLLTSSIYLFLGTATLFISVMKLRDMRNTGELAKLNWSATWVAYALLYIGLVFDMLLNMVVMTVVFLELPQELLTTSRMRRQKFFGSGWRQALAIWFCTNYLKPFDPNHCE